MLSQRRLKTDGAAPSGSPPVNDTPFSFRYSDNVACLLRDLDCNLLVSTYEAGKIAIFGPGAETDSGWGMTQFLRNFRAPMGVAVQDGKLAVSTVDEIHVFTNRKKLAPLYPPRQGAFSDLYVPMSTFYTGPIAAHDIEFGTAGLWAVNTAFSSLVLIDPHLGMIPKWMPPFIQECVPADQCHLNGLAMENGAPRYATAFGQTNDGRGWSEGALTNGCLMDITTGEIMLDDLSMPHSPRIFDEQLLLLQSATGELIRVDRTSRKKETICQLNGFARGLAKAGDYIFVGTSRIRENCRTFRDLPVASMATSCGVTVIHLPTGRIVGSIEYSHDVQEIYDVKVLPGHLRTLVVHPESDERRRIVSCRTLGDYWIEHEVETSTPS